MQLSLKKLEEAAQSWIYPFHFNFCHLVSQIPPKNPRAVASKNTVTSSSGKGLQPPLLVEAVSLQRLVWRQKVRAVCQLWTR